MPPGYLDLLAKSMIRSSTLGMVPSLNIANAFLGSLPMAAIRTVAIQGDQNARALEHRMSAVADDLGGFECALRVFLGFVHRPSGCLRCSLSY